MGTGQRAESQSRSDVEQTRWANDWEGNHVRVPPYLKQVGIQYVRQESLPWGNDAVHQRDRCANVSSPTSVHLWAEYPMLVVVVRSLLQDVPTHVSLVYSRGATRGNILVLQHEQFLLYQRQ